ncbi:MAG: alcohol dehydrogenase catalytic domain-containing protein [bacterium]
MKAVLWEAKRLFAIRDLADPSPAPNEVLIRLTRAGICGSDMHLYRDGRIGPLTIEKPFIIGHECAGRVIGAGASVDKNLIGRRVAVEPHIHCGRCEWCVRGHINLCPHGLFMGLPPLQGAMRELLVHPAHLVEPIPDSLPDESAVVLEPMSIALHAVRLVKPHKAGTAVILGVGVLGICVLSILRLFKGMRIICVDLMPDRIERAKRIGADEAILANPRNRMDSVIKVKDLAGGYGADLVFECAGDSDTLHDMCEIAAPGAQVAVIGTPTDDCVGFASSSARRKGLTIKFVRRGLNTLKDAISLAVRQHIVPDSLVTHVMPPSESAQAFDLVDRREDGVLKAIINLEQF